MCAFVKGNLNFAIKAVVPAQKANNVNAEPTLVVASTPGKFTLSASAGLALGVQPGDSIGFMDNLPAILAAVAAKTDDVLQVFTDNGLDINNIEDQEVFIKEMREIYIFKGYAMFESDGSPKMVNARTSKEEKQAMLDEHFDEILAEAREQIIAAIKSQNEDENYEPSEDEIRAMVTVDLVGSKQEPGVYGSKLATVSNQTGLGLTLNFTDGNVWTSLKRNIMPADRDRVKSTFKVDIRNPRTEVMNDGCKDINIVCYPIIFDKTEEVTSRSNKE